jgi:hypothetical protein
MALEKPDSHLYLVCLERMYTRRGLLVDVYPGAPDTNAMRLMMLILLSDPQCLVVTQWPGLLHRLLELDPIALIP